MALKRERSPSATPIPEIFRSSTIQEQTSAFQAAFSPRLSAEALQTLPEFRTATHKIAAWRKRSRQKSLMPDSKILYDLGHDDDGEKWAGGRLSNVLREEQAIKKQKVDEEARKKEVVKNLQERDYNIFALRKLLAEKKAKLHDEGPAPPTPQKGQAYEKMGMAALMRVDRARDATIAFILKQIDKVDEELKLVEALEEGMQDSGKTGEKQATGEDEAPSTSK
jgi:hypothetical protein